MNKKSKTLLLALSCVLLVGCGSTKTSNHEHVFADKYSYDTSSHWKVCTVKGCKKIQEDSKTAHTFSEWTVTTEATDSEDGEETRSCVCGYEETRVLSLNHTHTFDETKWDKDETSHWHPATCEHKEEKSGLVNHTFGDWEVTKEASTTAAGSKKRTCSICGFEQTDTIPVVTPVSQGFSFNSDITVAQKIHTTDQENFLNYSGEYYNITSSQLNSYNAKGTSENSFPNQVKLTWNYTAPTGKTVKNYSVVTGQKADLSDGYTLVGSTNKNISFYNAFLGTNYFKVIANFTDNTSETSDIKTFLVDDKAPRNLKVGTMSNCRDMGGRTNVSGGKLKQGLIYRTSDPANSGIGDISEWTKRMGVKTEIYVKDGGGSTSPLGSSVKFVNASMDYGATPYSNMSRNAERLRKVFATLGDSSNYPLMYHCRIGTDRTGICGVAINGVLGVPFNEVIQDYAFSNFGKIDGQRYAHKTPDNNGDDPAKYIDEILKMPGKNFQEQTIYSLLSIGVPAQTIQNVIDIMTEGNKITIPSNITVAKGNDLTNNGGTKKTSSDYTNPDTYYEISGSSKSVSFNYSLEQEKEVNVVAYLGCDDSSSKKLADGIELKIDGTSKTICDKTYLLSGFGQTQQAHRTGYMFNILGKYTLPAGNHTIILSGKNSDTFKIGAISVIGGAGNVSATSSNIDVVISGGGTGTGTTTQEEDPNLYKATFNISDATGWHNATTKWNTRSGDGSKATWNVGDKLPAGNYKVSISCKMTAGSHSDRYFYNQSATDSGTNADKSTESPFRYWIEIGSQKFNPTNDKTWGDNGMSTSSFKEVELISSMAVPANTTSISMLHGDIGYSLIIESVTFTTI